MNTEWSETLNAFWYGANGCEYIAYRGSHHVFVYPCHKHPEPPSEVWQFTRRIETLEDFNEALNNHVVYVANYRNERLDKITFIIESIWEMENATVPVSYFDEWTDEQIDKEVERYDYLWTK